MRALHNLQSNSLQSVGNTTQLEDLLSLGGSTLGMSPKVDLLSDLAQALQQTGRDSLVVALGLRGDLNASIGSAVNGTFVFTLPTVQTTVDVTCEIVLRQKMNPPGGAALPPEPACVPVGRRGPVYEFSPSLPKAFVASMGGVRQLGGKIVTFVGGNASAEKSVPTVFIPASAFVVADGPARGVQRPSAAATGTKKVLVARMRSTTHGQEPTPTINDLKERVFGMGISPVAVNFKSQSAACSENELIIEPGACVSGNTAPGCAEISDGVMNLDLDMDLSPGVDPSEVEYAAVVKLNALGLRDAATADYVMFLFPPGISPWIAYAYINGWSSFYSDTWGGSVSAHMHEVGHNFGLAHSGEFDEEYGDESSYMGYSFLSIGWPAMCYHGGQHRSLGWYSTHTTEIAASDFVSGQNELVDLFAFTDVQALSAGDPVIIKLDVASPRGYALYLQYNKAEDHNSGVVESANLITVVQDALDTPAYQQSWKVASLGEGDDYDDNLRVKVCSLDVVGSVDVVRLSISLDYIGDPCPPPSLSPPPAPLEWWEILLIALGALIGIILLSLCILRVCFARTVEIDMVPAAPARADPIRSEHRRIPQSRSDIAPSTTRVKTFDL